MAATVAASSALFTMRLSKAGSPQASKTAVTGRVPFVLTTGNIADISVAATLLDDGAPPRCLLADEAYDANHLHQRLQTLGTEVAIPSNRIRRHSYLLDRIACPRRDVMRACSAG